MKKQKTKLRVKCTFCDGTGKRTLETGLENLGNKIALLRLAKNITQGELAEKMGYSRTSITNLEGGKQDLPVHKIYELAEILGVEPRDLL